MSNEASKPAAPAVEQDERGAFVQAAIRMLEGYAESYESMSRMNGGGNKVQCSSVAFDIRHNMAGWIKARAASTSANVVPPQAVDLPPRVIDRLYQAAGVSTYHPDGDQQEKLHAFARNVVAETLARLLSASFISGKPVVMTEETRELARQVLLQRDNDTRTEQQKLADGAAFICDTRLDFPTSK